MADNNRIGLASDDTVDNETNQTVQKKASILPGILKWFAIVLASVLFVVAVTVVTVEVMGKKGKGFTAYPSSPEYRDTSEILMYYTGLDTVQTNITGQPPATVRAKVNLGYSEKDKETPSEISARSIEILDFLRSYFKSKNYSELENNEEAIKIEIRNLINDNILTKGKVKRVMLTQYDVILQD